MTRQHIPPHHARQIFKATRFMIYLGTFGFHTVAWNGLAVSFEKHHLRLNICKQPIQADLL